MSTRRGLRILRVLSAVISAGCALTALAQSWWLPQAMLLITSLVWLVTFILLTQRLHPMGR